MLLYIYLFLKDNLLCELQNIKSRHLANYHYKSFILYFYFTNNFKKFYFQVIRFF